MIPLVCDRTSGRTPIDLVELVAREVHVGGGGILRQAFQVARARNRDHILARQQPRERELRSSTSLRRRELADTIRERHVPLEIATLTPWIAATPIVGREIINGPETTCEKAAALLDEVSHRSYRVFDGHIRIDTMQVIDVDVVHLKPTQ